MSQSDDLTAINAYMQRTAPVTPEATALRNSWNVWYPSLGWYDKGFSTKVMDEASPRRNKFNLANATSPAQKAQVVNVITKGMDTNQMQGKPRKETLPTGEVGTQIKNPSIVGGTHPTIRQGSKGPAVVEWQKFLGTNADGNFGPNTTTLTVAWQKKWNTLHPTAKLDTDGVVGNKTWTAALGTKPVEAAKAEEPGLLAQLLGATTPPPAQVPAAAILNPPVAKPGGAANPIPPKPPAGKKPAAKPAAQRPPSPGVRPAPSAAPAPIVPVAQAGMFSSLAGLPLWAKIGAGIAAVAALAMGRHATTVNYSTGKVNRKPKRRAA